MCVVCRKKQSAVSGEHSHYIFAVHSCLTCVTYAYPLFLCTGSVWLVHGKEWTGGQTIPYTTRDTGGAPGQPVPVSGTSESCPVALLLHVVHCTWPSLSPHHRCKSSLCVRCVYVTGLSAALVCWVQSAVAKVNRLRHVVHGAAAAVFLTCISGQRQVKMPFRPWHITEY